MKEQWYKPGWEPLAEFLGGCDHDGCFVVVGKKTDHSNRVFLGNVIWDLSLMKYGLGKM